MVNTISHQRTTNQTTSHQLEQRKQNQTVDSDMCGCGCEDMELAYIPSGTGERGRHSA